MALISHLSDWITRLLRPIVRIRREEWPKTILMFVYFFLTITAYYIIKPVRDSLFLEKYGAENLPYVWLTTIVVLGFFASFYARFADLLEKNVLLSSTVAFFVINLGIFWGLARSEARILAAIFYIWVSIFSIVTVTQFWLYANDIFNPREAKRLFGFVGSGGILGGIVGGLITSKTAMLIGTRQLLLVAAFILLFCILLINLIWEVEREKSFRKSKTPPIPEKRPLPINQFFKAAWKTRYFLIIVALVCLAKAVSTLVDYQFKNIVQDHIQGLDVKTAFFGNFFAWLNTISFLIQFFLTSRILRNFGVGAALLLLPLGLLVGSTAILIHPALWNAIFTMLYDGSLNYSLNQSSKEVLYLPIRREIRYRIKPFIDMLGYRFAKGIGSILILVMIKVFHFPDHQVSFLVLGLVLLWIGVIFMAKKEYVVTLREFVTKEASHFKNGTPLSSEKELLRSFLLKLHEGREAPLVEAMRIVNFVNDRQFKHYLASFLTDPPEIIRKKILQALDSYAGRGLGDELEWLMRHSRIEEKPEILIFLSQYQGPTSRPALYANLKHPSEEVRFASACALFLLKEDGEAEGILMEALKERGSEGDSSVSSKDRGLGKRHPDSALRKMEEDFESALLEDSPDKKRVFIERYASQAGPLGKFFGWLHARLENQRLGLIERRWLPQLLAEIQTQDSIYFLERMLKDKDACVRYEVIQALKQLRIRRPELVFDERLIRLEIEREVGYCRELKSIVALYPRCCEGFPSALAGAEGEEFLKIQRLRENEAMERIFLLLALLCEPEDMQTVFNGLMHGNEQVKANAIELLDNLGLETRVKRCLFDLIDIEAGAEGDEAARLFRRKAAGTNGDELSLEESLRSLLESDDFWLFMSGAFLILLFRISPLYSEICQGSSFPSGLKGTVSLLLKHFLEAGFSE